MRWSATAVVALVCLSSCSSYVPKPLIPKEILTELRQSAFEVPANGISTAEAVTLALVHNPELAVWRREHEIAAGLVLSEGVWTNPQFRPSLKNIYSRVANPFSFALDFRIFSGVPGEVAAKTERARAGSRRVLAEIETLESDLAAKVQVAHARLTMLDRQIRIAHAMKALHDHVNDLLGQQIDAGVATRIDGTLLQLQRHAIAEDEQSLMGQREASQAKLASLIGADPTSRINIRGGDGMRPVIETSQMAMEDEALVSRPDLRAKKEAYLEAERNLELVHLSHTFWPKFLQTAFGGLAKNASVGLDAGIELPIFDSGDADIHVAQVRRDKAREVFKALLHKIRGEIRLAVLDYKDQRRRCDYYLAKREPALVEAEKQINEAAESGAIDALKVLGVETQIWKARGEKSRAEFGLESSIIRLRQVTGHILGGTIQPERGSLKKMGQLPVR